ncbi:MAG: hypothetical protein ACXVJJ_06460 [Halobacteriota archaeon]
MNIASNSTATFAVKITAASNASGNYDLRFHAISGKLTSENRTIPIQIGNPAPSAAKSKGPTSMVRDHLRAPWLTQRGVYIKREKVKFFISA